MSMTDNRPKYSGIIFDLDGVICSTDEYHYLAWKKVADEEGVYFDRKINDRLRGVSRMKSLDIILGQNNRDVSAEEKEKIAERKNLVYQKLLDQMGPADIKDGVQQTLDQLKEKKIRLAVGSSSRNARKILSKLGLRDYFDAVSDGTNISKSKPDPEVFLKAAEMLGLGPSECLVVEDAAAGIAAAKAGHFDSAGIGNAAADSDATYHITNFNEINELVK